MPEKEEGWSQRQKLVRSAARLAHDAVAEELAGHVGDGAVGPRLHRGRDIEIARQPKVRHLGREPVRLLGRACQQHIACT